MTTNETTRTLKPGDRAPDVTVPAVTSEGMISLAEHLDRGAVLLALFRGLY